MYGVDLARWWGDRRWKGLLGLIDQLPAASRFNEAVLNDPVFAEEYVKQEQADEKPEWAPRLAEFDLHATLLRDLIQAVNQSTIATIAAAGGKPPKLPDYPRPRTGIDKAREEALHKWADSLIATLTPHAVR